MDSAISLFVDIRSLTFFMRFRCSSPAVWQVGRKVQHTERMGIKETPGLSEEVENGINLIGGHF